MKLQFDSHEFITSVVFIGFVALLFRLYASFVHKPNVLRSKLKKQGINGPPPTILLGNLMEIMKSQLTTPNSHSFLTHNTASLVFPKFEEWRKQYGEVFMFSLGNIESLKLLGPLLGDGILTSNGTTWAHQRKTLAPELYNDKVKGMVNIISESCESLLSLWNSKIEAQSGGVTDINIDEDLKIFSGNVISRTCFGSDYSKGEEIFFKLGALQEVVFSWKNLSSAVPGMRYLPTKTNRKSWILAKEVKSLILEVVKERKEKTCFEMDFLQMVIEGSKKSNFTQEASDNFIIDNCKNISLAAESTAVVSSWCLMLLATNQNWQDRARAEVLEICRGRIPDYDMLSRMKQLTMIIHETLRLYPPAPLLARHTFKDMKFGNIDVPKGTGLWILILTMHTNPDIWGDDAYKFNPERFANGVAGACKHPHAYMPFGVGPRICLGQNLAMLELKMLIALILSNFSFSLSPRYIHSPAHGITMKPDHGVQLLVTKL
ncbi:cytochrome P450 714C2 [Trifolium repens]|nr:cytochrome P450 714C2 [Trifolium repens]